MGRKESCGLAPEGLGCKSHKLGSATWSPVPTETVRQHSIPAMVHPNLLTDSHLPECPWPFNTAHLLPFTLLNPEREKLFSKAPGIKTLSTYPHAYNFRNGRAEVLDRFSQLHTIG